MLTVKSAAGLLLAAALAGADSVSGQSYPNKPVRIVTGPVGGANDFAARLIAPALTSALGQAVIVDNRGAGFASAEIVSKGAPDGYMLLLYGSPVWISPLLQRTPYDPVRDFSPISLVASSPHVLVVHPSLPVKSVKDLIALAKARPGELNYTMAGVGGASHLAGELFKSMAGVNIVRVAYTHSAVETADLISGQVQMTFGSQGSMKYVSLGKIKALAVTSTQPSALYPGLLTMSESGLPGFESGSRVAIFAPVRTPPEIVHRLNQEIVRFLAAAEVRKRFLDSGVEVVTGTPEELGVTVKAEMTRLGKLIKDIGIKADN